MNAARFRETLDRLDLDLSPLSVEVLQVNLTRLCNQACAHCHVDASPDRREMMAAPTIDACLAALSAAEEVATLDITGGAPELHPGFARLVEGGRALGRHVMVRHNLTVTLDPHPVTGEPMEHLPAFFAENGVEVVASLPCYERGSVDGQRGDGVFAKSIESLRRLNAEGYGAEDGGLRLDLVHNPLGASLPGDQAALEADYRRELAARHGIRFNRLFALANMPVNRFARRLEATGSYDEYLDGLVAACNPAAARGVMCRRMVSVGWDGTLYDCDFNQMLGLAIGGDRPLRISEFDVAALKRREIRFASHCFGCTAGAGSSCGGATVRRGSGG